MHIIIKKLYEKIMGRLIIDGNSVYEVDEECLKKKNIPPECGIKEALERQERKNNQTRQHNRK